MHEAEPLLDVAFSSSANSEYVQKNTKMDPLSIITGTTGTVSFAITSAVILNNFINSILDAPADIAAIARDVDALTKILDTLQGWLEKDVIRPSAAKSLSGSLNA
jgi:hypothetical protein